MITIVMMYLRSGYGILRLFLLLLLLCGGAPCYADDPPPLCTGKDIAPPEISTLVTEQKTAFHNSLDENGLTGFALQQSHIKDRFEHMPLSAGDAYITGLASGGFTLTYTPAYTDSLDPVTGQPCRLLKKIDITVQLNPQIYIASNYQTDSCWYRLIFDHEQKHLQTDRLIAVYYARQIKQAVTFMFDDPQDKNTANNMDGWTEGNLKSSLDNILNGMFRNMAAERRFEQDKIDNDEGYLDTDGMCAPLPPE